MGYFVRVAGTWRETMDPEVHRTDFWVELKQGLGHNRYYFSGIDEAAECCQGTPEDVVAVSPLLRLVIKDAPERWPEPYRKVA